MKAGSIPIANLFTFAVACFLVCSSPSPLFGQDATAAAAPQPAAKPEVATLPVPPAYSLEDGTPVRLRLTADLSSANATVGQTIDFKVVDEVRVKDLVVIPQGAIAWATVTEAQHKRHLGRGGKLNIMIDKVRLADGERAPLRAVRQAQGGGHVGAMTTGMVATGILFFPVAPLFLFMHGKDVTIPEGTEVTAYVNGDFALDRARFLSADAAPGAAPAAQNQQPVAAPLSAPGQPPAAAVPPAAMPAGTQAGTGCTVSSNPLGADIILDGKFVGNTPSTLQLSIGDHKLRIEKSGYKSWEKDLKVTGAEMPSFTINLEPADTPPDGLPPG